MAPRFVRLPLRRRVTRAYDSIIPPRAADLRYALVPLPRPDVKAAGRRVACRKIISRLCSLAPGKAGEAPAVRPAAGAGSAHPVTAYVANFYSGTVTPINTATNTALSADQGRQRPARHRDHPWAGRPPTRAA